MTKDEFLEKCKSIGVEAIVPIENDYDEGFKVLLNNGDEVYVIFMNEYGESWIEFESKDNHLERRERTHIMTAEESAASSKRHIENMVEKYKDGGFFDLLCKGKIKFYID